MMREKDLDHALRVEEEIMPSSGFSAAVMNAIRREAAAPPSIAFPWKRVMPGLVLAAAMLTLAFVPAPARSAATATPPSTQLAVLLAPLLEMTRKLGVNWLAASLLLAWVSVKLSMQLTSSKT